MAKRRWTPSSSWKPDVLVTDIEMPKMTGLEIAAQIRTSHPAVKTVILTTFARPGYLRRALDAGARGYLLKDRPAAELADAVRRVHLGLRVVDPALAAEAWSAEVDPLTDRERQILQRAGDGRATVDDSRGVTALGRHCAELSLGRDCEGSEPRTEWTRRASPAPRAGSKTFVSRSVGRRISRAAHLTDSEVIG